MKKILSLILFLCFTCYLIAEQPREDVYNEKIINSDNEYFGETIENTFQYSGSKKMLDKIRYYYNKRRKLVKQEAFLTNFVASKKGFYKVITYFDENRRIVQKELYTNEFREFQTGHFKQVFYYNSKGEVYLTHKKDQYGTVLPNGYQ